MVYFFVICNCKDLAVSVRLLKEENDRLYARIVFIYFYYLETAAKIF